MDNGQWTIIFFITIPDSLNLAFQEYANFAELVVT
ncbi:hypothetical protein Cyast_1939 [Cyanobacterium stanieri PCC 7202]|uniref:Uncharacterized protein n=1 Tax=Cyanobacterium stanieri (strain ATCC 29140 / PCC 7202) TaxID=292563 RepID=K9YN56_CYASC|nr:hypothetical protein Cyast_1939 [Cyanobacterium stanieri PCC 7202]